MTLPLARIFQPLAIVWFGIIIGISFIATPVKFQAPSLTLGAALDAGRHIFVASHIVQLVLGAMLALGALAMSRPLQIMLVCAIAILCVQHVVLLPILDARATTIIAGGTPSGPSPHLAYIMLEIVKLGLVAVVGFTRAAITLRRPLLPSRT